MSQAFPVYVINLDRSPDRWAAMSRQLEGLGLQPTRAPAVDARRDAAQMRARRGFPEPVDGVIFHVNAEGRRYVMGEEACFQSHLQTLEAFLASGARTALILEDDAELAPDAPAALTAMAARPDLWDVVRLEAAGRRGARRALRIMDLPSGRMQVASMRPCSGSCAYMVTRRGAEGLIAAAPGAFEPYDTYLSSLWRHGLRMLDCAPAPARQPGDTSLIHEDRPPGAAPASKRAPGLGAKLLRLKADLKRRASRRIALPRLYRGAHQGWITAPWNDKS